jgi:hypothetical protein
VEFKPDCTIKFVKNNHLVLYWHSTVLQFDDSIEELLFNPTMKFKFMEQSLHSDTKCWTLAYHHSAAKEHGIVERTSKEWITLLITFWLS